MQVEKKQEQVIICSLFPHKQILEKLTLLIKKQKNSLITIQSFYISFFARQLAEKFSQQQILQSHAMSVYTDSLVSVPLTDLISSPLYLISIPPL